MHDNPTINHLQHPDTHVPWSPWSEDQTLHLIIPYSNFFRWRTRRELVNDCIRHLRTMANVSLHVVELAYGDRPFEITGAHPNDIQLRTNSELWHKEQLINIGVSRLPVGWKYAGYVDGDFHFNRHDLALETIHQLQHHDFVQLFSSYADLTGEMPGQGHRPLRINSGFAYTYVQNGFQLPDGFVNGGWRGKGPQADDYYTSMMLGDSGKAKVKGVGATGGAWAWRRPAFDLVGGMLDICALGHGDWFMTFGLVGEDAPDMHIDGYSTEYRKAIKDWQRNAAKLKKNIGYVDCFATHHFHGAKSRRGYSSRDIILVKHQYSPSDLRRDWQGVYQLTSDKPAMRDDFRRYFLSRTEDDIGLYGDAPKGGV